MSSDGLLSPRRRDAVLALIALALLAGPLWAPSLHVGDSHYRYDRAEVTVNGTGIEYATASDSVHVPAISEEIACSGHREVRPCAFERLLLDNLTVPTEVYTNNPFSSGSTWIYDRYRYVLLNGTVYEPTHVPNRSVRRDGLYRLDLDLRRVPPERALRSVSVTAEEASSTVAEVARTGETSVRHRLDPPATPIRLDDGTYYRVYRVAGPREASLTARLLGFLLTYATPLAGLYVVADLSRRVRVTYVGDRE